MRGCGCIEHPAFPTPSECSEGTTRCKTRAGCAARSWRCVCFFSWQKGKTMCVEMHGPCCVQCNRIAGVLSLPLLWGGWREAPGGANSRITKQPPPVTSLAPLTMCHPRASFARLDPTKVGGIRKSELRWTRGRSVAARRPHPSRRRFAPLWMRLIRRACGLILMVRSAATPRVSNHEAGIETEEETM